MVIAVPVKNSVAVQYFDNCSSFAIFEVADEVVSRQDADVHPDSDSLSGMGSCIKELGRLMLNRAGGESYSVISLAEEGVRVLKGDFADAGQAVVNFLSGGLPSDDIV